MKKVFLLLCVLPIVSLTTLSSADLGKRGIEVISTKTDDGRTVTTARDSAGNTFEFITDQTLTEPQADILVRVKDTFYSWEYLKIASLRIVFTGDQLEIMVFPSEFIYNGVNFAEYLPSGMQFYYYRDFVEYDFRMFVSNLFIRISGQYFTEEQLCEKLFSAVQNPVLYIQTHDPEYLLEKLKGIENLIDALNAELNAKISSVSRELSQKTLEFSDRLSSEIDGLSEELKSEIKKLKEYYDSLIEKHTEYHQALQEEYLQFKTQQQKRDEQQEKDYLALKDDHLDLEERHETLKTNHQNLEERHEQLKTNYELLKQDHEQLEENHESLKADYEELLREFLLVRNAIIVINNRGLFGAVRELNTEGINRLIELKKANPALTQKEARSLLKEEGIKMTKNEIFLVYSLYFGEFE